MTDTAPDPTPEDPGEDTQEHPIVEVVAGAPRGWPPAAATTRPDGERAPTRTPPPLDRLRGLRELLRPDETPAAREATARILGGRAVDPEGERPEGEHYQRGDESPGEVGDDPPRGHLCPCGG